MNGEGRQIGGRHRSRIGSPPRPAIDTAEGPEALNMHILGPGDLAVGEWEKAGLDLPDRAAVRRYRLERVRQQLRRFDYAGIVLFDPLNVRYATDSTNMQPLPAMPSCPRRDRWCCSTFKAPDSSVLIAK